MRKMGIRTVMITGDNPLTAKAIAVDAVFTETEPLPAPRAETEPSPAALAGDDDRYERWMKIHDPSEQDFEAMRAAIARVLPQTAH